VLPLDLGRVAPAGVTEAWGREWVDVDEAIADAVANTVEISRADAVDGEAWGGERLAVDDGQAETAMMVMVMVMVIVISEGNRWKEGCIHS
jgi:hypothetical protein